MRSYFIIAAAAVLLMCGCSKDSDDSKDKIEHTVRIQFVDADGESIVNGQNHVDAVKIVCFDSDGTEYDFFNENWFGMNGFTVDPFNKFIYTIYLTLPENGNMVTQTYMRFYGEEPDVFTAEYEVKEGNDPDEPYGGGTVKVQCVQLNGDVIWDRKEQSEVPYKMVRELPEA